MATSLSNIRLQVRDRLTETYALVTPAQPSANVVGTPGAKTISYRVSANNAAGETLASAAVTVTTAAAALDATHYVALSWGPVSNATSYNVYRSATDGTPSTTGRIGTTGHLTFSDTGIAASGSLPTENTTGLIYPFWSETDLLNIIINGCKDLWRGIIDLHQGHFVTIDATNVSLTAGATELTGVPTDCFRVLSLEPRDITQDGSARGMLFKPKPYKSAEFQRDRSLGTLNLSYPTWIYYDILNPGPSVGAPSIVVSRKLDATLPLRLVYVHTLPALDETSDNPIPGESDNALIAWATAYARANEHPEGMPDAAWLSIYATDKQSLLTALTPRQEQEEEVVEDIFSGAWGN